MSGIIRIEKNTNYTHISNVPANDKELSWEARGILYYLLTKPDKWECRNQDLINKGPAGGDKIERILDELQEHGYLARERTKKGDGTFDWITTVYEMPIEPDQAVKDRIAKKKTTATEKRLRRKEKQAIPEKRPDGTIGVLSTDGLHPHIVITESVINESKSAPKNGARPAEIPAYKIYVEVTGKYSLNKPQIEAINQAVGAFPDSLDKWRKIVTAWALTDYRITNIKGMLDWFKYGIPQHKNGNSKTPEPPKKQKFRWIPNDPNQQPVDITPTEAL